MTAVFTTLRNFDESDLLFDEGETRGTLKFFFGDLRHQTDAATITTDLRSFAQGLLVEAIDATYALGYVEIIFKAYFNPGAGMKKAMSKMGRKAAAHWFKHATATDLPHAKISSRVRDRLALNFKSHCMLLLGDIASSESRPGTRIRSAHVRYGQARPSDTMWG